MNFNITRHRYVDMQGIDAALKKLGFESNHKLKEGFRPNYTRGKDVLFIIQQGFFSAKVRAIVAAFQDKGITVYGIHTQKAPRSARADWVAAGPVLQLISLNPLQVATVRPDGQGIEFIPHKLKRNKLKRKTR